MIKKYWNKIYNLYNRDDIELRHKLLIVLIIAVTFGDIIGTAFDIINGLCDVRLNILLALVCLFSLFLCLKLKKYELGVNVMVITIAVFVLPAMFFTEGGIHSGMLFWMFFALVIEFMMMRGFIRYVMFFAVIAEDVLCVLYEYYHPDCSIKLDSDQKYITDVTASFVVVVILLCSVILIHILSYERQQIKLEEQKVELLENQKRLEEIALQAQKADQAKSDFLANMSHEIRTPINAVLGMDEMILRESSEEEIKMYAADIQSSGRTLLSIINDILDFSKVEAGKMELYQEKFAIADVIRDAYNMIKPKTDDKGLELIIDNDENIPSVLYGDETRLRQVMLNLMANAAKYTSKGTVKVEIRYDTIDEQRIMLKVNVSDTGIGIKEENIQYLFQTFRRIDIKENRKIEGTGLGLALTKKIIELLDGNIAVSSVYGEGSTFSFQIPLFVEDATPVGDINKITTKVSGAYHVSFRAPNAKVLVVDDVAINLKVFAGLLKATEIQIDKASSGEEALNFVRENKYDIIFMDHMMPQMDGVETLEHMKDMGDYINKDTPVIVLTANAIHGVKDTYLDAGFDDYISKPIRSEILESMIIQYLPPELVL